MSTETPIPSGPGSTGPEFSGASSDLLNSASSSSATSTHPNTEQTTKPTDSTGATKKEEKKNDDESDDSMLECNICLDTAKDAVVSMCGHLFCWPCLYQWLETRPMRKLCPVCKASISKEKVIPLYGRNSKNKQDPRNKIPSRPAGQRTEPEQPQGFQGFGFGDGGFQMSFGIGAFPFGFFASWVGWPAANQHGVGAGNGAGGGNIQYESEQQLSKFFLYLAFICIAWLFYA